VEYSITEYGRSLEPILEAMHEWGTKHTLHKIEKFQKKEITNALSDKSLK
jgi:DNA-binding HxlR family transcriptional regulator